MEKITPEWLQDIEALKEVPLTQLQWLIDHSSILEVEPGKYFFKPGDEMRGTYIVLEGSFRLCMLQGKVLREVVIYGTGSITGYLPFSRARNMQGTGDAIGPLKCLVFPVESTPEMIRTQFELTQALVHIMTTRVRDFTALEQQNEKMVALGKLSAGLAHELNNPAAAVVRGAASLLKHLKLTPYTFKKVMSIHISEEAVDLINDRLFDILSRSERPHLTMMERSSQEDDTVDWMADFRIDNDQEVAENLVDFGFTLEDLNGFKKQVSDDSLSAVLNWINNNLVTEKIVIDIDEASRRIAGLVGAVKNFTHVDQGHGRQYADIHNGIRNTITILQHKIRHKNIILEEHFDPTLPEVNAMIGELNQVWTNLIDNALDAMEANGKGVLQITTRRAKDNIAVVIADNGPGIPNDIKSNIFDPFFTTKDIGKGTGLGLDVVNRIIKQHQGSIRVNSQPGKTEFIVEFPIK